MSFERPSQHNNGPETSKASLDKPVNPYRWWETWMDNATRSSNAWWRLWGANTSMGIEMAKQQLDLTMRTMTAMNLGAQEKLKQWASYKGDVPPPGFDMNEMLAVYDNCAKVYGGLMKNEMMAITKYSQEKGLAFTKALETGDPEKVVAFLEECARTAEVAAYDNPDAINKAKETYGLRFEDHDRYPLIDETDEAELYQIMPIGEGVDVNEHAKPVIILSPFILEDGIQGLKPGETKEGKENKNISYVHSYANKGRPTYIVHFKDIRKAQAVAKLTPERNIMIVQQFLRKITKDRPQATVAGTCQGAIDARDGFLSGKWEGLADDLIQTVPPNELAKAEEWQRLLGTMPKWVLDLDIKMNERTPFGDLATSSPIVSQMMRLKDMQGPLSMLTGALKSAENGPMGAYPAAIMAWLAENKRPMPIALTERSVKGATIPIERVEVEENGVKVIKHRLPYKLFEKDVYIEDGLKHGMKHWGIVYGQKFDGKVGDTVVPPEAAVPEAIRELMKKYPHIFMVHEVKGGHIAPMTSEVKNGNVYKEGGAFWMYDQWAKEEEAAKEPERIAA